MIELKDVCKTMKAKTVLQDITIKLEDNRIYGLKGINGSGKTMLMRMISGLIYPTNGSISIDGKQLGSDLSFPQELGILIENPSFLDSYTGSSNLKLLASLNEKIKDTEIREALLRVGLDPDDKRKYKKYSLGMKQRLGIAAAIMEKPKILILDEPTNALDADGIKRFETILKEEKERGALIILSCHDEGKLNEYADIIVTMENGRICNVQESGAHA